MQPSIAKQYSMSVVPTKEFTSLRPLLAFLSPDEENHFLKDTLRKSKLSLVLYNFYVSHKTAQTIGKAFLSCRYQIVSLGLHKNDMDVAPLKRLLQSLASLATLESILFAKNDFSASHLQIVSDLLTRNSSIRELYLVDMDIDLQSARVLSNYLSTETTKLKQLNLWNTRMKTNSCSHLANALKRNRMLTKLDLRKNAIGDIGVNYICDMLRENTALLSLNLSYNGLSPAALGQLSSLLKQNDNTTLLELIREIDLSKTSFSQQQEVTKQNRIIGYHLRKNLSYQKDYFLQVLQKESVKGKLNMLRLMVVGDGRQGKTATIRSLLAKPFSETELPSTRVADISLTSVSINNSSNRFHFAKNDISLSNILVSFAVELSVKSLDSDLHKNFQESKRRKQRKAIADSSFKNLSSARKIQNSFTSKLFESTKEFQNSLKLSIWDFGGQRVFHALHSLFLSPFGTYLLVFSLSDLGRKRGDVLHRMGFWLQSLRTHASSVASIMIIGTFLDEHSPSREESREVTSFLKHQQRVHQLNIVPASNGELFFALDNASGEGIEEIREATILASKTQRDLLPPVSLKLLYFMEELEQISKTSGVLPLSECSRIHQELFKNSSETVEDMLLELTEHGLVTYFADNQILRSFVVLQPQILFRQLGNLFMDLELHLSEEEKAELQKQNMLTDFHQALETGIISKDLLSFLLRETKNNEFLIEMLKKALILSTLTLKHEEYYILPSLIKSEVKVTFAHKIVLRIVCSLELGLFERIICSLINAAEVVVMPTIKRNYANVEGKLAHLELFAQENSIFVQVKKALLNIPDLLQSILQKLNGDIFERRLVFNLDVFNTETSSVPSTEDVSAFNIKWLQKSSIAKNLSSNFDKI